MLKKSHRFLLCISFLSCVAFSQNREIQFEHLSLEQLKLKAQKTGKNIFIDCYTSWCGPCKYMSKNIFTKDAVADFMNEYYVSAKIDMECKEGPKLAEMYEVGAYPTYLFIDSKGNLIYKFIGAVEGPEFIAEARKGLKVENNYRLMNLKYKNGNRSAAFMNEFIKLKISRSEISQANVIAEAYFNSLSAKEKSLPENWFLFGEHGFSRELSPRNGKFINYLIDHYQDFISQIPDSLVYKRITKNYQNIATSVFLNSFFEKGKVNLSVFDEFKTKISSITSLPNNDELLVLVDLCKAVAQDNIELVTQILSKNVSILSKDSQQLLFDLFLSKFNGEYERTSGVYEIMRKIILSNKNANLISYAKSVLGKNDPHFEKFDAKNLVNKFDQPKISPVFHPDFSSCYFSYKKAGQKEEYLAFDIESGIHPIYNKKDIDSVMLAIKLDTTQITFVPSFTNKGIGVDFNISGNNYSYLPKSKEIILKKEEAPKTYDWGLSPNKRHQVFYRNYNIFVRDLKDSSEVQLTFDKDRNTSYMMPNIKWFGNNTNRFIIQRKNDNDVRDLTVVNSTFKVPFVINYKDALPGDTGLVKYELLIGDVKSKTAKVINIEKWEGQEITVINSGNENLLYFTRLKRTHDQLELCSVDGNGDVKVLISETYHPNFNDIMFHCKIINKGNDILFWSDRTGWGHYYHYNKKGKLLNPLTEGSWTAGEIISIDEDKQEVYFIGYGKDKNINPNYSYLYKVNIDGSNLKLLTPENANHNSFVHIKGNLIIDNYSRIDTIPLIVARDCNGKMIDAVIKPNIKALLNYGWRFPEQFKVKAADNKTDLYGIMWKPDNFDPNKKYPIVSQVYPGPFTETVWTDFTVLDKYQNTALAQRGFIVVCFGHRGSSPIRNKAYASYGFGNLRDYPLADDKYGLEQLAKKYTFIDDTKIGVLGHSGGALMAVTAMCTYPDFYKVAVASSGNYDNTIYHKNWGEYYQGIGEDLQFTVKTPMELVTNLKGKLLLVTGESDQNVNPSNTFKMVDALIKADKDFDLLVMPGQGHHYEGVYDDYFERRKRDYFTDYFLDKR